MERIARDHANKKQPDLKDENHSSHKGYRDAQYLLDLPQPSGQRSLRRSCKRSSVVITRVGHEY